MVQPINSSRKQAPPAPRRMTLGAVTRGTRQAPLKTLVYGPGGIGKTTFGAHAPAPVFLPTEDGTNQLDVARLPRAESWQDVLDGVAELTEQPHEFRTLVLDSLTAMEHLVHRAVCERNGWRDIESPGFGKGYTAAFDLWRTLLPALERLQATRGMHVVLIGHAVVKKFQDPDASVGAYDRYQLTLCSSSNADVPGLFQQWADDVLFASYETAKKNEKDRRAISTGARLLHSVRTAAYEAKNRHSLPERFPLDWDTYWHAVQSHTVESPDRLRARIESLLQWVDMDTAAVVRTTVADAGDDARELARVVNKLAGMVDSGTDQNGTNEGKAGSK